MLLKNSFFVIIVIYLLVSFLLPSFHTHTSSSHWDRDTCILEIEYHVIFCFVFDEMRHSIFNIYQTYDSQSNSDVLGMKH